MRTHTRTRAWIAGFGLLTLLLTGCDDAGDDIEEGVEEIEEGVEDLDET